MNDPAKDNLITLVAIGLVAYASADIAHHALGHGGACLSLGGSIISLSSIYVHCSLRGVVNDLGGPLANLLLGLAAALTARIATRRSATTRLFLILAAAFNLLWFALQLVFSAASRTDDWAWAMHVFQVGEPVRYGMIALGALAYLLTMRGIAVQMAAFAASRVRARRIVMAAWITAGATACATAALDPNAVSAIVHHALPQSIILSIGLLFVPRRASSLSSSAEPAGPIAFSVAWTVAAALVGVASILLLGPGVAIAI
jgi:hypothetical protein